MGIFDTLDNGLGLGEVVEAYDPVELGQVIFPWQWASYQRELLMLLLESDWRRTIILAPPRHRKTTVVGMWLAIELGEDYTKRVMVASHTKDFSALLIKAVVEIMKSPPYRRIFGDLLPTASDDVRWTTYEKYLPNRPVYVRDPTFLALSPDSGTPGYGADIIVCDDLVSQANSVTPTMRAHVSHWFHGSLLKRLEPAGKMVVVGARFYRGDLYGDLLQKQNWRILKYTATKEKPLWPARWGSKELEQQELDDPVFFPAQYKQEPLDLEAAGALDPSWFQHYIDLPPLHAMTIFAGIDPPIKDTVASSKFAYTVIARDHLGTIYHLDSYSGKHDVTKIPELLDDMWRQWHPHSAAFEANGPQESVMKFIIPLLKTPLSLVGVPSLISKPLRLASIAGHVRSGRILVKGRVKSDGSGYIETTGASKQLVQAWADSPFGDIDLLDSAEKAISLALAGPPPAVGSSKAASTNDKKKRRNTTTIGRNFARVFHTRNYANMRGAYSIDVNEEPEDMVPARHSTSAPLPEIQPTQQETQQ